MALYNFFVEKFWKEVKNEGPGFHDDVIELRRRKALYSNMCIEKEVRVALFLCLCVCVCVYVLCVPCVYVEVGVSVSFCFRVDPKMCCIDKEVSLQ